MPPTRTIPPAKAIKTERTHEENQERAYIAASRRSDRSLEARVESARRASEIHKRRTGRSLRVTEQDVVNEEMYEEEDDDLPMQYRRLTAHLQTGSVDFNRRLAAYLTNQVAMRSAMDQMINNSYAQQYPHAPQFAHNESPSSFSPTMSGGNVAQSPTTPSRPAPYPSPYQNGFRFPQHRATSTAAPSEAPQTPGSQKRRQSTPATHASPPIPQPLTTDDIKPDFAHHRQTQSATAGMPNSYPPLWQDMGPFTTSLPPESQQMLGPGLDPADPMTSMLMAGSQDYTSSPYYPWSTTQDPSKLGDVGAGFGGMYSTLAPSVLDTSDDSSSAVSKAGKSRSPQMAPSGLGFSSGPDNSKLKAVHSFNNRLSREDSMNGLPSGQITPGEGFWDSFVQDGAWTAEAVVE